MSYTVHQAKTQLSRLLKEAEAGQEITILRGKKPVAKLVPIDHPPAPKTPFRYIGAFEGLVQADDSAFDPMTDDELAENGFDALLDGELAPPARSE